MNCPKCGEHTLYLPCQGALVSPEERYRCEICDWESEPVGEMVKSSPAYRLAKLKAEGAAPGWYGPDGEKAIVMSPHPSGWGHRIQIHGCAVWGETLESTEAMARLCGLVEVTNG